MSQPKTRSQNGPDANLEQIREILFGEQTRDQSSRLKELDKQTAARLSVLRKELREELQSLSADLNARIADLLKQLKDEQGARLAGERTAAQGLKQLSAALDRRATAIEVRLAAREENLRQHIAKTAAALEEEFTQRHDEQTAMIEEEFEELKASRADRVEISELFQELALRLTGELKRPAPKN